MNDVWFTAWDTFGNHTDSRHLDLRIDLAAPNTTVSLNNEPNPANWPAWFPSPVQVRLDAADIGTGGATSGVDYLRYRLDGGAWQTYTTSFAVSGHGAHSVEYYAVDNVGNIENTRTVTIQIDEIPPGPPDFTFNGGVTQTTQTLVTLNVTANDVGSGVSEMRLSGDGRKNWTPWEAYATERLWLLPAISRQWWPVYLQVRDGVLLESPVISHTIYLDVNPRQPRSQSFRLFDYWMSSGGGSHASASYAISSTVGQVLDSAWLTSTGYLIQGGYQAGRLALPIAEPPHDEFDFVNGILSSGTGGRALTSSNYRLQSSFGEPALPYTTTTVLSQQYQHQPGFLAAALPSRLTFALASDGLNDIAVSLHTTPSIPDAESLATYIETQGGTGFGSVQQLLKWDNGLQNFLAWSHEFGFGDNFPVALGDYVFLVTSGGPASVTFYGRTPEANELSFDLTPGPSAADCVLNFLSLPFDKASLVNADQLSDDIGGVVQALDWESDLQAFLAWSNVGGFGDNFPTTVGYPYIVCLDETAPASWP